VDILFISIVRMWKLSCITVTCPRVPVPDSSSQMSLASTSIDILMSLQSQCGRTAPRMVKAMTGFQIALEKRGTVKENVERRTKE